MPPTVSIRIQLRFVNQRDTASFDAPILPSMETEMTQVLELQQYKCDTVTRNAIDNIPMPATTKTYQPIAHGWLLDELERQLADMDIGFAEQHHGLSHDGARYFGVIHLEGFAGVDTGQQMPIMGVRNSLDKRFGAQVCFGNQVMVCANLCFWGTYMLGRKHTTHIMRDLPEIIADTLVGIPAMNQQQTARFEQYQQTIIAPSDADHLIVEMLRRNAVNPARIGKVVDEWDNPTFDHGADRNVWRLFNAATQALKGVNIHEMPSRTENLTAVCDEAASFAIAA